MPCSVRSRHARLLLELRARHPIASSRVASPSAPGYESRTSVRLVTSSRGSLRDRTARARDVGPACVSAHARHPITLHRHCDARARGLSRPEDRRRRDRNGGAHTWRRQRRRRACRKRPAHAGSDHPDNCVTRPAVDRAWADPWSRMAPQLRKERSPVCKRTCDRPLPFVDVSSLVSPPSVREPDPATLVESMLTWQGADRRSSRDCVGHRELGDD